MDKRFLGNKILFLLLLAVCVFAISCSSTKYLKQNEYLLTRNIITLKSENKLKNKGEIKDNLSRLLVQRPNTISWLFQSPIKLWYYNYRYNKYHSLPDSSLPKLAERPVLYDSSAFGRSVINMKNYLFNLGYFYARIKDTAIISGKKATVRYSIDLGNYYRINDVTYDVPDSAIEKVLNDTRSESVIQKGKEYTISMIDEERSRIVSAIRNKGYYHFSQENIFSFQLDTFNKVKVKNIENPLIDIVNNIADIKIEKNPTADVDIIIRKADDSTAFSRYYVTSVSVYPDYSNALFSEDSTLIKNTTDSINFYFHNKYVHTKVLSDHIFITPGSLYSQADYDMTLVKLNELGIFKYIKIVFTENPDIENGIDCNIYMNRNKKYDLSQNDELSSGTTYDLGLSAGINFHNRNFEKGANLFTLSLNGGLEYAYKSTYGNTFINHFLLLTEYLGLNASVDFPKFITPIGKNLFEDANTPHTIIAGGSNLIDRLNYFRLVNTSANYAYSWKKSKTITWTFSPMFVNIIRMPYETDSFKNHLDQFPFLKNSYKSNFVEGENISFTYSDAEKKHNKNYSYIRLGLEEAGGALSGLNLIGIALNDLYKIKYAQYTKIDFDARHFFTLYHSTFAFRFWGGIGIPYGQSNTLPYIKQYFEGGPYSLRGWQIRSLGPGTYYTTTSGNTILDMTGDMKLEMNGEYRFPIAPLFAGAIKMNGALFVDGGNIWLAKKDPSFPGGEFELNSLGQSIAMDAGAGARFDIASFLTFRLDVAMPLKKPYIFTNNGWVLDQIAFTNSSWRANNLVLSIVIGYPF